jgi:hypothetical protein
MAWPALAQPSRGERRTGRGYQCAIFGRHPGFVLEPDLGEQRLWNDDAL